MKSQMGMFLLAIVAIGLIHFILTAYPSIGGKIF